MQRQALPARGQSWPEALGFPAQIGRRLQGDQRLPATPARGRAGAFRNRQARPLRAARSPRGRDWSRCRSAVMGRTRPKDRNDIWPRAWVGMCRLPGPVQPSAAAMVYLGINPKSQPWAVCASPRVLTGEAGARNGHPRPAAIVSRRRTSPCGESISARVSGSMSGHAHGGAIRPGRCSTDSARSGAGVDPDRQ